MVPTHFGTLNCDLVFATQSGTRRSDLVVATGLVFHLLKKQ